MHPLANSCSLPTMCWQKVMWDLLGKYTLARVNGKSLYEPFRNTNLPSGSHNCSVSLNGVSLPTSIVTPFDLESAVVAWKALGNCGDINLGMLFVLKWVSCRNTNWGLPFLSSLSRVERRSGMFKPLMLWEITRCRVPSDEYTMVAAEEEMVGVRICKDKTVIWGLTLELRSEIKSL